MVDDPAVPHLPRIHHTSRSPRPIGGPKTGAFIALGAGAGLVAGLLAAGAVGIAPGIVLGAAAGAVLGSISDARAGSQRTPGGPDAVGGTGPAPPTT